MLANDSQAPNPSRATQAQTRAVPGLGFPWRMVVSSKVRSEPLVFTRPPRTQKSAADTVLSQAPALLATEAHLSSSGSSGSFTLTEEPWAACPPETMQPVY